MIAILQRSKVLLDKCDGRFSIYVTNLNDGTLPLRGSKFFNLGIGQYLSISSFPFSCPFSQIFLWDYCLIRQLCLFLSIAVDFSARFFCQILLLLLYLRNFPVGLLPIYFFVGSIFNLEKRKGTRLFYAITVLRPRLSKSIALTFPRDNNLPSSDWGNWGT